VKHVVAETRVGNTLKVRRLDRAAERTCGAEAHVIREDEQYVRRSLGGLDTFRACIKTPTGALADDRLRYFAGTRRFSSSSQC